MSFNLRQELEDREKMWLASPASWSINSRGREIPIEESDMRTCYMRDRDRILHSASFRRMKHKTQVFISPEGDHFRTRLTHTLEVSQIARTCARVLRYNEDLTEAIALGHDLGHTPFGHAGERVLNQMNPNGFSHALQSVRVVEKLEHHGEGLNLTWEVRDGIKHHTMGTNSDFELDPPSTSEGYLVRYADKIAYINHDIDDAIHAGIITNADLPRESLDVMGETVQTRIDYMIHDLIMTTKKTGRVQMSEEASEAMRILKEALFQKVYIGSEAKKEEGKAEEMVKSLYLTFRNKPELIPENYRKYLEEGENLDTVICDYISTMSDNYAIHVYEELFIPQGWKFNAGK